MSNFFRILKINIYSLIAIPFLLIAFSSKMIAKALGKVGTMLGMGLLTGVALITIFLLNDPSLIKKYLGVTVTILIVFGVVIAILRMVFSAVRFVLNLFYNAVIAFFETLYNLTYSVYVSLNNGCSNDYMYLTLTGWPLLYSLLCIFFVILRLIDYIIMAFIHISLVVFVALSFGVAGYMYYEISSHVKYAFGIDMTEFLNNMKTGPLIESIILFMIIVANVFVVLVSLGLEWREWARELSLDSEQYDDYIDYLEDQDRHIESIEAESEEDYGYILCVDEHLEQIEAFMEEARYAMSLEKNPLLENACSEYVCDLSDITDALTKGDGYISKAELSRLKPLIRRLDKQRDTIKKLVDKQVEILNNPARNSIFFTGCNTKAKLEKRYKALCKTYHPDLESGDEETFKVLTKEYTKLKDMME